MAEVHEKGLFHPFSIGENELAKEGGGSSFFACQGPLKGCTLAGGPLGRGSLPRLNTRILLQGQRTG